jgi:lysosomal alpha-mannosidase
LDTFVDSIDVKDKQGKEIVLEIKTPDIKNNKTFYTDSNGLEMIKRILDYRPTYNLINTEFASGNYFPVTSCIYIEDSVKHFAVIPDRSEGGSSLFEGEIELMLHRRLLKDDMRGVGEALNETDFYDGQGLR